MVGSVVGDMISNKCSFVKWGVGQQSDEAPGLPVVRVQRVERIGGRARVMLQEPCRSLEGYPRSSSPSTLPLAFSFSMLGEPSRAMLCFALIPTHSPVGVPQAGQNLAPAVNVAPHFSHAGVTSFPQFGQNLGSPS